MINAILWVLFVHLIADFFLQTNWMAQNKSKRFDALYLHILVYWMTFLLFTLSPIYAIVNAAIHLVVDFFTSRINSYLYQYYDRHWFFCGIGVDQFIHSTCLIATLGLL